MQWRAMFHDALRLQERSAREIVEKLICCFGFDSPASLAYREDVEQFLSEQRRHNCKPVLPDLR